MSDAPYPHCNSSTIHAPGDCHYCDKYPKLQKARKWSGEAFSPLEANGWSGNVAVKAGEVHTHMGFSYIVGDGPVVGSTWVDVDEMGEPVNDRKCKRPSRGFYCKLWEGHGGPCPAYARLWKKIELYVKQGVWWP